MNKKWMENDPSFVLCQRCLRHVHISRQKEISCTAFGLECKECRDKGAVTNTERKIQRGEKKS